MVDIRNEIAIYAPKTPKEIGGIIKRFEEKPEYVNEVMARPGTTVVAT